MLELIFAGIGGVLFHCLVKLRSLQMDYANANLEFNWKKDYIKKDFVSILLSFLSVGIWYLIFGEWVSHYPLLQGFIVTSFVVMGAIGSYIIQLILSQAKKKVRGVVNEKTNIADAAQTMDDGGTTPPPPPPPTGGDRPPIKPPNP